MPRGGPSVAGPRGFERTFDRTWSGGGVPGQGRASRGAEPDPVKLVQEFLPIDREAFQAADTLLNAAPGSDEFRRAEGRLIREAGETTGRMLRDTAKEALHTVRSKEFWKGSRGGRRARRGASPSSSPLLDPGDDGSPGSRYDGTGLGTWPQARRPIGLSRDLLTAPDPDDRCAAVGARRLGASPRYFGVQRTSVRTMSWPRTMRRRPAW